jgi:hypothetical protein
MVNCGREVRIAGDVDLPPRALVARCEPQHEAGAEPDRGAGNGAATGRRDFTALQDGERDGEREELEAGALSGVGPQRVARPARAAQQVVDRSRRRG